KAIELMALGNNFSMEEALQLGIVNTVLDADNWWESVLEYAGRFVPPNAASMAVGRIKRSVQSGAEMGLEAGLSLERELQQQLFQSDDAREGIRAFNEKRRAEFCGH
ncbi:MAG TPA: enoyl-CoA hydratase/isomerase family protein, partial [Myxococcales bacterium]|nr:enoyl-CoA hydratase/isomerase family protein [Myxococcales bacterium]